MLATKCECSGGGCSQAEEAEGICHLKPGGYCFSFVELEDGEEYWMSGCLAPDIIGLLQVCFFRLNCSNFLKFVFLMFSVKVA